MIKVGQTTTNQTIALPYELTNDGDTSISLQELKGNTTQSGTPTPTSPVNVDVVKGKNLFDYSTAIFNNNNAEEITKTNEYLKVVPKTTSNYCGFYINTPKLPKTIKPSLSFKARADANRTIVVTFYNKTSTISLTTNWQTYKLENATINATDFTMYNGADHSSTAFYIKDMQIEENTSATPYLPYNTIQAKVVGKNLFDINDTELGDINTSTGEDVSSTTIRRTRYIQVQSNTTYTISFNNTTNNKRIFLYNSNKQLINTTLLAPAESVKTITTTSETRYIRLKIVSTQFNAETQLEQGTTATTYEAYKSNNYPITLGDIELCKIGTYQDRIYKNNGKWYLYKAIGKYTFTGASSEVWGAGGVNGVFYATAINNYATSNNIPVSNYYSGVTNVQGAGGMTTNNTIGFINNHTNIRFYIRDNTYTTNANDFKTWLSTHNLIVYYVLDNATTTEITDETLLEQLEAIGELYRGTNNIMITDTIAPVENIIIEKSNAEFDLVPYIKREPKIDYIDRKGDTGYTADGHYFENIIARKRAVEFELIPMSQEDYADVISRFMNITSIPVFISDTYTNQNLKLNMFKKAIISNTQLTEYGRIRGTKISLEEI